MLSSGARLRSLRPEDSIIRWSADGPHRAARGFDRPAGEPIRTIRPTDLTGVLQIRTITMSDDEKSYAYSTRRMISHLFLVEGAR
jgi:hypothetical protein